MIDRDGTIIEDKIYLSDPKGVELIPGAIAGLILLRAAGFGLIVVTNQSGVGHGYYTLEEMNAVNHELRDQLQKGGVQIDGIYSCPHTPDDDCSCRKPKTGLLIKAANELGFDPSDSIVIGDKEADINLGKAVGAVTYLVLTGHGVSELEEIQEKPYKVVADLHEAAYNIIKSIG